MADMLSISLVASHYFIGSVDSTGGGIDITPFVMHSFRKVMTELLATGIQPWGIGWHLGQRVLHDAYCELV